VNDIPILETERLILRGPEPRDCAAFVDFFMSDRARYVGGPLTRGKAWRTFALEIGHWRMRGFGMWAVTMRGSDDSLGLVGCWFPEGWPEKEIGWIMWRDAEGKGIAHEAALAARDHAYGVLGWPTAVSYIDQPNARSIRLAERLGAARDDAAQCPDGPEPCLVYRHPGSEVLQ